jgi:hypothetical protein
MVGFHPPDKTHQLILTQRCQRRGKITFETLTQGGRQNPEPTEDQKSRRGRKNPAGDSESETFPAPSHHQALPGGLVEKKHVLSL